MLTFLPCLLRGSPSSTSIPFHLLKAPKTTFFPSKLLCVTDWQHLQAPWLHGATSTARITKGKQWEVSGYDWGINYFPLVTSACLWGRCLLSILSPICCTHPKMHQACGRTKRRIRCVEMKHRMFPVFKLPDRCCCFSKYQFKEFEIDKMVTHSH